MSRITSRLAARIGMSLVLVLGAGACKDSEKKPDIRVPADIAAAAESAVAAPPAATTVDVCALFTADDFKAVTGEAPIGPGTAGAPRGSLLGDCRYGGTTVAGISISARPAREYDPSVKYLKESKPALEELSGVGDGAVFSAETGMLVKYSGRPYMLLVLPMKEIGEMNFDREMSIAVGKAIAGKN